MRAPTTHSAIAGPMIAATQIHSSRPARECPSVGLPTVTITATDAASSTAHIHCERLTRRCAK